MDADMMSALQRYIMQQKLADQGSGPRGSAGMPAAPMGPGIADPFNQQENGPAMVNPQDGQNEFDPRRRMRPYMDQAAMPVPVAGADF